MGTWRYNLHGTQNEIWWTGKDGTPVVHSVSLVCHVPAEKTKRIEYAGKAIQILPNTIDPKDFPCLEQTADGNYRLVPVIPAKTTIMAADGLEVTFLWELFREQYEKNFSLISWISDIAYKDDVSAAIAESDLFWNLPYGTRDLRVFAGCKESVVSIVRDFLHFSHAYGNGCQTALQEAADHMSRKKNGLLKTTRVWYFSGKAPEATDKCPFSICVDCKPISEYEANLRLYFKVTTPDGIAGYMKF